VEQGGTIYGLPVGITGFPLATFTTLNFSGTFTAASFTRVIGAGPVTPIFDGSVATTFGFAAGNSNSNTLTHYYDNFRLNISTLSSNAAAIPTLSEGALLVLGSLLPAAAMSVQLRRRKR
jgi:hypothetical protein